MAAAQLSVPPPFSLASRLSTLPISADDVRTLMVSLWEPELTGHDYAANSRSFEAYVQHIYTDLCRIACTGQNPISAVTHEQLIRVCRLLRAQDATLASVLVLLGSQGAGTERLVKVGAGVLLPLNISGIGGVRPGKSIDWAPGTRLSDLTRTIIRAPAPPPIHATHTPCAVCNTPVPLPTSFNAYSMEFVAGFEVIWTSSLADHLRLVEVDEKLRLYIFHHTGLLQRHLALSDSIISRSLILETFETLALLLPRRNPDVQKWFDKLQKKYNLDPGAAKCPHFPSEQRHIGHFNHWRDRLRDLKEAFDCREPPGPKYVWRDRSKPIQWWTFWIAVLILILTVVFGLIQSITGILQLALAH